MLKGILFVIAIIVTFDIGKTLIDQYRAEQEQEQSEQSQEVLEQAEDKATEDSGSVEERQLLDLSLPEGVEDSDDEDANESGVEQGNMFDNAKGSSDKSMSIKTRPVLEFQTDEMKPDVSGIKLDLKKDL